MEGRETTEKDLEMFQRTLDDEREWPGGGSLGGVRALLKREGLGFLRPAHMGWAPCKSRELP
jgi:hypothetical protein